MVKHKGIEIEIQVDKADLMEHADHDDENGDPKTVSRYVEAVTGARFGVCIQVPTTYTMTSSALSFAFFIDGKGGNNIVMREVDLRKATHAWKYCSEGVCFQASRRWKQQPYIFNAITKVLIPKCTETRLICTTAESLNTSERQSNIDSLGLISVKVYRMHIPSQRSAGGTKGTGRSFTPARQTFSEKELKGRTLTHTAKRVT